jgi:hypothetical protein
MYTVYTKWVAYELCKRGFKIIDVQPNPHKPEFDCYIFEDSKALRTVMKEINALKRH